MTDENFSLLLVATKSEQLSRRAIARSSDETVLLKEDFKSFKSFFFFFFFSVFTMGVISRSILGADFLYHLTSGQTTQHA